MRQLRQLRRELTADDWALLADRATRRIRWDRETEGLYREALGYARGILDAEWGGPAPSGEAIVFAAEYVAAWCETGMRDAIWRAWQDFREARRCPTCADRRVVRGFAPAVHCRHCGERLDVPVLRG